MDRDSRERVQQRAWDNKKATREEEAGHEGGAEQKSSVILERQVLIKYRQQAKCGSESLSTKMMNLLRQRGLSG